ncbi:CGNR zinc finger domain-containing protein [Microbacterium sp. 2P01SA-2]|uniref:CGNR zinc finger domain-containing protein n=1 Tax=unclassified Microbacterium TaxID=2609290 RepID=UPI0039A004C1
MPDDLIRPLVELAATRPEGEWPEQLDLDRFHRILGEMAPASRDVRDVGTARQVRDTIGAILLDGTDTHAYAILNRVMADRAVTPSVDQAGLRYRSKHADAVSALWAQMAEPLLSGVVSGVRGRTKRCASAPCVTPFINSQGGGQEYCCARCATRARVRRHRAERANR